MDTNDIYDAWHKKVRAEGRAEGEAEGEVRALLAARGLSVSAEQEARIRACGDVEQLETWLRCAVSAASCDEVLSSS